MITNRGEHLFKVVVDSIYGVKFSDQINKVVQMMTLKRGAFRHVYPYVK